MNALYAVVAVLMALLCGTLTRSTDWRVEALSLGEVGHRGLRTPSDVDRDPPPFKGNVGFHRWETPKTLDGFHVTWWKWLARRRFRVLRGGGGGIARLKLQEFREGTRPEPA